MQTEVGYSNCIDMDLNLTRDSRLAHKASGASLGWVDSSNLS